MTAQIIAVSNNKGGTAKTTTTRNIGAALNYMKRKVMLIDFDPQGHLTLSFGLNPRSIQNSSFHALIDNRVSFASTILHHNSGVDLVPTNIGLSDAENILAKEREIGKRSTYLKKKLAPLLDQYDYILLDCPPSLGYLTTNALTAATGVLIPVQCQFLAYHGLTLILETYEQVKKSTNPDLRVAGILPTLYNGQTLHAREVLAELRTHYQEYLIDIPIPYRTALADAMTAGESIYEYDSNSDVSLLYARVAEVLDHAEKK